MWSEKNIYRGTKAPYQRLNHGLNNKVNNLRVELPSCIELTEPSEWPATRLTQADQNLFGCGAIHDMTGDNASTAAVITMEMCLREISVNEECRNDQLNDFLRAERRARVF